MPRIVILSTFLSPFRSGAEACAEEVPLALSDRFECTIVTARLRRDLPRKDLLQHRIPIIRVGFGYSFDKWLYPFLAPFVVRRLRPDIIHAILETFAGLALHFCKWVCPPAKRILTLQTTNRSFLKGLVTRSPHRVTAISSVLAQIGKELGRNDVTVIPNGIPVTAIRAAMGRNQRVPGRILFVGRLESMKGVDTLLTAFAEIPNTNYQLPTTHLRIIGEGSRRAQLDQMAKNLGIADRVTFAGYVSAPQIYDEYAQAEIFCVLSRSEALGNVFLEAQAAGCAVIGTNVGGIPEIIDDGVTGLLVPPEDPEAAADLLQKLLSNTALRKQFAENGRKKAEKYDWARIAERYGNTYGEFL